MVLTPLSRRPLAFLLFGALLAIGASEPGRLRGAAAVASASSRAAQNDGARPQTFTIVAKKYSFSPTRIEVAQDDLVKITLVTEDIPHSFTVDTYRIAKRAAPHQSVTFEFRADQAGTFPFYCNLVIDEGCRNMKGELVVRGK